MPRRKYKWFLVVVNDYYYRIVSHVQLRQYEGWKMEFRVIREVPSDFTTTEDDLDRMSKAYQKLTGKVDVGIWWDDEK